MLATTYRCRLLSLWSYCLQVTDIVNDVKKQLVENFEDYDWMDKKTADAAVEKAEAMSKLHDHGILPITQNCVLPCPTLKEPRGIRTLCDCVLTSVWFCVI